MFKKLVVSFALAGLAVMSAAQYHVTLFEPSEVNGQVLKPGDYKLVVNGDKAVISRGKNKVEATVSVHKSDNKYSATSVRYASGGGKFAVQEIRLGGTDTKVVFSGDPASAAPAAAAAGGSR